jgi:hypothetical protein
LALQIRCCCLAAHLLLGQQLLALCELLLQVLIARVVLLQLLLQDSMQPTGTFNDV